MEVLVATFAFEPLYAKTYFKNLVQASKQQKRGEGIRKVGDRRVERGVRKLGTPVLNGK